MAAVLIVDDEKNIRSSLKHCLLTDGYDLDFAVNGEDALEKLEAGRKFDVMILDVRLPGMDGMEVLRRSRSLAPEMSVIMMTAYGTIENAVEAMKLGAVDYITKPFSPDQIRSLVRAVIERKTIREAETFDYGSSIEFAKACINRRDYAKALEYVKKAIAFDPGKAEAFNLMGVLLELRGDVHEAQKQYRAALAVDPTYRPAEANLDRTAQLHYTTRGMDLGDVREGDGSAGMGRGG